MDLTLIRNATLKLGMAGRTILIDPFLAPKHSMPSYAGRSPNPLVDLPVRIDEVLSGVELCIVSHLHADHFDAVAKEMLPKDIPLICQPGDEGKIGAAGFTNVTPLSDSLDWHGIRLSRREGRHAVGPALEAMGSVMGFLIEAVDEPKVYWAGDTVLYPHLRAAIADDNPEVIVIHPCGAKWDGDLIAMDAEQAADLCRSSGAAQVVATHMEALDHTTVDRAELRRFTMSSNISPERLLIPTDGETLHFAMIRTGSGRDRPSHATGQATPE